MPEDEVDADQQYMLANRAADAQPRPERARGHLSPFGILLVVTAIVSQGCRDTGDFRRIEDCGTLPVLTTVERHLLAIVEVPGLHAAPARQTALVERF